MQIFEDILKVLDRLKYPVEIKYGVLFTVYFVWDANWGKVEIESWKRSLKFVEKLLAVLTTVLVYDTLKYDSLLGIPGKGVGLLIRNWLYDTVQRRISIWKLFNWIFLGVFFKLLIKCIYTTHSFNNNHFLQKLLSIRSFPLMNYFTLFRTL